ncbi:MAG: TVP38/TMEM64 family protein, partial [Acetobacteraceae bacterium]|nr:TVP38/TMEM64 family protein [Acetobacteraceae bacterium]
YVPQTVIFALLGKGIRVDGAWQMGLAAVLFVVSVLIGLWLLRRHRAGQVLEDQA